MSESFPPRPSSQFWETSAQAFAQSREVSSDLLIEWPAQLEACGEIAGKRILDVGCGTGDKAHYLARHGASSVVGIDASGGFDAQWRHHADCENLELVRADFQDSLALSSLSQTPFDLIVCFQSLMYARDLRETLRSLTELLKPTGAFILSVPHPFRFAILKHEIEGWGIGEAYQRTGYYAYPSPWKPDLLLEHSMPRVSDYVNALASSGLIIRQCVEPMVTDDFREKAPLKAEWMDRYVGIIIFRAERVQNSGTSGSYGNAVSNS